MKTLANKKGFSYILTCVIVIVITMLMSVCMEYAHLMHLTREQQDRAKLTVEGILTQIAVDHYDLLKQGADCLPGINTAGVAESVLHAFGFSDETGSVTDETGVSMSRPEVTVTADGCWKVTLQKSFCKQRSRRSYDKGARRIYEGELEWYQRTNPGKSLHAATCFKGRNTEAKRRGEKARNPHDH